jgi:hypothetical protein
MNTCPNRSASDPVPNFTLTLSDCLFLIECGIDPEVDALLDAALFIKQGTASRA